MFVLNGLDDIWNQANGIIDSMPDALIEQHKDRLSGVFRIHTLTMMSEIQRRLPGESSAPITTMLQETLQRIENGDLREALRSLALEIIAIAPPSPESMDPAMEGLFERTNDKSFALLQSVDRNGVGIMPLALRLMFQSGDQPPEKFYRDNLNRVFPQPEGIMVVAQTLDM